MSPHGLGVPVRQHRSQCIFATHQTTNNVFNMSLQQYIVPQTLFAWMRVRIASALAKDGLEWSKTMGMHNSGTYNKYGLRAGRSFRNRGLGAPSRSPFHPPQVDLADIVPPLALLPANTWSSISTSSPLASPSSPAHCTYPSRFRATLSTRTRRTS